MICQETGIAKSLKKEVEKYRKKTVSWSTDDGQRLDKNMWSCVYFCLKKWFISHIILGIIGYIKSSSCQYTSVIMVYIESSNSREFHWNMIQSYTWSRHKKFSLKYEDNMRSILIHKSFLVQSTYQATSGAEDTIIMVPPLHGLTHCSLKADNGDPKNDKFNSNSLTENSWILVEFLLVIIW